MEWFATEMTELAKFIQSKLRNVEPMNVQVSLNEASRLCHISEKTFTSHDKIDRDHCHFSGNFQGFAHNSCNINYRNSLVIPVVFHKLSGYDSHFIIRDLAKYDRISLLPINNEKYISFTKYDNETNIKFRFIDSFRFMASSLNELASFLKAEEFVHLRGEFSHLPTNQFQLLCRKASFPYDYIDSMEKLEETQLLKIDQFYNQLNDSHISPDEYAHSK